jgi:hypothetical protein
LWIIEELNGNGHNMVNSFIQFKNPRRRWKQSGKQVKLAESIEGNANAACVISIVDDRVYHGEHPLADPFSMARIPSKNIRQSSRNLQSTNTYTPSQSQRVQLTSSIEQDTEDIGVYSQRDVMVLSLPLYNESGDKLKNAMSRKGILAQPTSFRERQQQNVTGRSSEIGVKSSEKDEEDDDDLVSVGCTDHVVGIVSSNSNFSPSDFSLYDDENTSMMTNPNAGCWMDMCTSLCTAVAPSTSRSSKAISRQNITTRAIKTERSTSRIDSDAVQTNPRRYKQQEQNYISCQESEQERSSHPEQVKEIEKKVPVINLRLAPSKERHHSSFTEVGTTPRISTPPSPAPVVVYPIARYSDRLNSVELVERRRRSLRKFLTFRPVVMPGETAELFKNDSTSSDNSDQ